jgi:hypothetical protein
MAKKKKAKSPAKNTAKKKSKPIPPWKTGNSLVTAFLHEIRLLLTKVDPADHRARVWRWPTAGEPRTTSLGTIRDVVDLLSTASVTNIAPPGKPGTFLAEVAACVNAYPWPTSPRYKVKNKKPYGFPAPTVNLYEIGQVVDLMLQAINAGGDGGGGGGSRWPPTN